MSGGNNKMKIAGVITTGDAKFGPIMFKGNIRENIEKLNKLGYEGVEISLKDPKIIKREELREILKENNLVLAALGTGQVVESEDITLTDPNEIIRKGAVKRLKEHISLASKFRSSVIIGLIRGNLPEDSKKCQAIERAIEACQECADFAQKNGVIILIEMINRYEVNWLNSISEGISFLKKVKKDNVLLHIDTFHMNIEDPSFNESIIEAKNLIGYVHFADSNRWAPGYGHINFREIISALREIDYQGFISLEVFPLPSPDIAAKKGIENIRRLLSKS
jgi:sugar phosphate isomerase/epimerase